MGKKKSIPQGRSFFLWGFYVKIDYSTQFYKWEAIIPFLRKNIEFKEPHEHLPNPTLRVEFPALPHSPLGVVRGFTLRTTYMISFSILQVLSRVQPLFI